VTIGEPGINVEASFVGNWSNYTDNMAPLCAMACVASASTILVLSMLCMAVARGL